MGSAVDEDASETIPAPEWDYSPLIFVLANFGAVYLAYGDKPAYVAHVSVAVAVASVGVVLSSARRRYEWWGWLLVPVAGSVINAFSLAFHRELPGLGSLLPGPYYHYLQSALAVIAALASVSLTVKRFLLPAPLHAASAVAAIVAVLLALPSEVSLQTFPARLETFTIAAAAVAHAGLFGWLTCRTVRQPNSLSLLNAWVVLGFAACRAAAGVGESGDRDEPMTTALYAVLLAGALSRARVFDFEGTALFRARQEAEEQRHESFRLRRENHRLQAQAITLEDRLCDQILQALRRIRSGGRAVPRLREGKELDGRYRIVRRVGAGGMGSVYEATQLSDGGRVALKVLDGPIDLLALSRLAREAGIARAVDHPNVVSVIDVNVAWSFLVMEFVGGGSLEQEREQYGRVAWALPVLHQIALGLAALHEKHIVHRDIKPANVLLSYPAGSEGPGVKIGDFGISRVTFEGGEGATGPSPACPPMIGGVTTTGAILGTPKYLAPERADAQAEPEPASDVYSFGVLAYELLSNREPFDVAPVFKHLGAAGWDEPPSLRSLRVDVTGEVSELVSRCLAVEPARRPTAGEIAEVLAPRSPEPTGLAGEGARDKTASLWSAWVEEGRS